MSARAAQLGVALALLITACAAGDDVTGDPTPDATADVADVTPEAAAIDAVDEAAIDEPTLDAPDELADDATDATSDTDASDAADAGDAGSDASDDAMDARVPPDAGPLADSLPTDTVFYFTTASCPVGWVLFTDGAGRVAVPTLAGEAGGATRGVVLRDGEERTHTHAMSGTFAVDSVSYVGIVGGGNRGVSAAGDVAFTTTTSPETAALPYVQLLVCRKVGPATPRMFPLPAGMMLFTAAATCPAGFSRPAGTQGRLPVGLPEGFVNGARFGATPGVDAPMHTHAVDATLATTAHGIALASGCCGSGYAHDATFHSTRPTSPSEPAMPTLSLLQCQKD